MTLVVLAAAWLAGTVLLWRLPALPNRVRKGADISVVIPARDEERTLPTLLSSLRQQVVPAAEIVVVDDGSTDQTARVAAAHGAQVVTAPPLPAGWAGKPWACHVGAVQATCSLLLFLDADVRLGPEALGHLAAAYERGLLSVQPYHEVERVDEHASALPNVVAVMASGIAAVRPSLTPGLAFGPCLLMSQVDLEAAGGFASVRGEVLEDAELARRYAAHGLPVRCYTGGQDVRFRMYPNGGRSIVQGWAKGLSGGARLARPLPLVGTVMWVTGLLSVVGEAIRAPSPLVGVAGLAFAAQLHWMLRRLGSFRWWTAPLFPVGALAFVGLFSWSTFQRVGLRRVTWRGRHLKVGRSAS